MHLSESFVTPPRSVVVGVVVAPCACFASSVACRACVLSYSLRTCCRSLGGWHLVPLGWGCCCVCWAKSSTSRSLCVVVAAPRACSTSSVVCFACSLSCSSCTCCRSLWGRHSVPLGWGCCYLAIGVHSSGLLTEEDVHSF